MGVIVILGGWFAIMHKINAMHPSAQEIVRYSQLQCGASVCHIFFSIGCFVLMQDMR